MMTPQTTTDFIVQGSVYVLGTGGAVYSWFNNEKWGAGVIVVLTAILLLTNILLNIKKLRANPEKSKRRK